jgi:uncharacterized membrane protein YiaA
MDAFAKIIDSLNTGIDKIALPAAILGMSVFLIGLLIMPIFPDFSANHKGYFMRAMLAALALGLAPTLLRALHAMGQSAGA